MQIGKNGLTSGVIETLKAIFKNQENVELRILKYEIFYKKLKKYQNKKRVF